MKLRIGLIGHHDAWQSRHLPALRVLQDRFDVRAVFSTVAKHAENMAVEFQADVVDGYRVLVDRCDIDAVMVLDRDWLGWLPMLAACEAGKAVYWAGDLSVDVVQDQWVREAIDQSGVSFMREFPRRFTPATLRLKELIATRLGKPRMVFCHRRLPEPQHVRSGDVRDPVKQEMLELVDWVRYVVGRSPEHVFSVSHAKDPGAKQTHSTQPALSVPSHPDYQCMSLLFSPGENCPPVTAQISCGTYFPANLQEAMGYRPHAGMQICCEHGIAFVDLPSTLVWFDEAGRNMETLETEMPVGQQLLSQFHCSVTSLLRRASDLDDIFMAANILSAAAKSEREGRQIPCSS